MAVSLLQQRRGAVTNARGFRQLTLRLTRSTEARLLQRMQRSLASVLWVKLGYQTGATVRGCARKDAVAFFGCTSVVTAC
jgi:hypothetical protein